MNYEFLKLLLTQAEAFEHDLPLDDEPTLAGFSAWLHQRQPTVPTPMPPEVPVHSLLDTAVAADVEISMLVSCVYRYVKLYGKKALADTPVSTIDEFTYLVQLLRDHKPSKTELIEENIHEKTTGTEILRRLIGNGLIEQFDDLNDRRSKRLKLTDAGLELLYQIMPRMNQVSTLVAGELSVAEKQQLVDLLQKLHLFHNPLFLHERETTIAELAGRIRQAEI
ncbi:MAG: winged helix DNA-binding protein [Bacteroidetes bacterium]|nr:winged helix DNA-binding protein [Fibrella sp.]